MNELFKVMTNNKFEIKKINFNNSMIKIINISCNYTQQKIAKQNYLTHNMRYIKSLLKKAVRNKSSGMYLGEMLISKEVHLLKYLDPLSYDMLMKNNRVKIGWEYCKLYEYFHTNTCYKCFGYGHSNKKCLNTSICALCII